MSTSQCSLPIEIGAQDRTANGLQIPVRRLWVKIVFPDRHGNLLFTNCLLDTATGLCVVPWSHQQTNDLDWQPLPGSWPPSFLTWQGVPCVIGRTEVWLPVGSPPFMQGPRTMIAKFAQATPRNQPGKLPILLG